MTRNPSRGPAAVICGVGAWLPPQVVSNHDLAARLDTSDQWIRERTGIAARRRVGPGVATGDLAVAAGELALKSSGCGAVDMVVLGTTTPDHPCPATAPEVASRLGLTGVGAFDVSAVCSSFLYGLATATGLIAAGIAERVLLIGAETFSSILDPDDRTTAAIFGDGAGAVVLRAGAPTEPGAIGPVLLGSDGTQRDLIKVPAGGSRDRGRAGSGALASLADHYFRMRGGETYRHAVERTTEVAEAALDRAGWSVDSVDRFAAHQANARIVNAVSERLGIAEGPRRLSNITRIGNTAAASLPLLLADSAARGALRPGDRTLLAAFGGGATWGAATVVWPDVTALIP